MQYAKKILCHNSLFCLTTYLSVEALLLSVVGMIMLRTFVWKKFYFFT